MSEPTTTDTTPSTPIPVEKMPNSEETAVDVTSSRYVAPSSGGGDSLLQDDTMGSDLELSKKTERESTEFYWTWDKFQQHLDHVKGSTTTPDPVYKAKALNCISPSNPIRKIAIKIAHHWTFDAFILSLILINCVFMIGGSPYAPCCRAGETVAEGGAVVSAWSEAQTVCATDTADTTTAVKSFSALNDRNASMCAKIAADKKTVMAFGQGKCAASGMAQWRDIKNADSRFPDHPAHFPTDHYWQWEYSKTKCCVPLAWATTNGIYTEQKPDFYPADGPPEVELQPQLCADTAFLDVTQMADYVFTACFTFEMVVKIIAMGFIMTKGDPARHMPGAYLRDAWNWLDFVVVLAAWIEISGLGAGISVLRTFRVLRPLRALNKAPSMKMLVRSLLRSVAPMVYVILLMLFVLLLWGIVGTQLWNGLLHGTCQYYDPASGDADASGYVGDPGQDGVLCGLDYIPVDHASYAPRVPVGADPLVNLGGEQYAVISNMFYQPLDKNSLISGKSWHNFMDNTTTVARVNAAKGNARVCDDRVFGTVTWSTSINANATLMDGSKKELPTMMCRYGKNPNYDLSSFDNLGNAVLWVFASITLEGWVDSMYNVNQVWSFQSPVLHFFVEGIYFTFLYLIGSMFMLNLTLAVIWEEFENERERQEADEDELISQELHILQIKGIEVQDRDEAELKQRQKKRADSKKAELTGDPVPDPWGPACIRNTWYKLAIDKYFGFAITGAILLNTVTMGLEYHNWKLYRDTYNYGPHFNNTPQSQNINIGEALSQPMALTIFLYYANYVFTFIFIFEMIVKMIGLSIPGYWADNFNKFDFVIVMFSIVELITVFLNLDGISGLSVLRSFRLLRVLKLAKSWSSLQELLITIVASLQDVTVAAGLACLMMFIFTLLGMEAFGGQWNAETFGSADDVPRANFDRFLDGFMTVFQVLTGENWNDLLWASYKTNGIIGYGYFLLLTFVGNYMIFNLFLAILLAKFEEGGDEAQQDADDLEEEMKAAKALAIANGTATEAKVEEPSTPGDPNSAKVMPMSSVIEQKSMTSIVNGNEEDDDEIPTDIKEDVVVCYGMSLMVLSPNNGFRKLAFALAGNKTFDQFILLLIIVSSIFLAMDEPWVSGCACYDPLDIETHSHACTSTTPLSWVGYFSEGNSMGYYQFLLWSDLVITIIFTFEMLLKIVAFGFAFHKHSYLRNGWNVLDFNIVLVSLIALATGPLVSGICDVEPGPNFLKALRALRAFRALRPLRVIKRDPGLRLVINSLFQAAESIGTVILVTLLFMMILAILGQQFFIGTVALCNDGDAATFPDCVGKFNISGTDCGMLPHKRLPTTFTTAEWGTFALPSRTPQFTLDSIEQCEKNGEMGSFYPRVWDSLSVNFDGFGHSLTTVFEVASGEMWPDIMVTTIDGRGIGQQPLPRTSSFWVFIWYFMVQFMIAFVMLNVFIGVIIEKYNENKDASEGSGLLTNDQKIWVETMKLAMNSKAKKKLLPPSGPMKGCRMSAYRFVIVPQFDYFIMACIMLNVFLMGSSHYNQPVVMHDLLTGANLLFNVIFTIEMLLKWAGIGMQYFQDSWNLFDCFLVALSWIAQTGVLPPSLASLFRIFRVARMVRLVRNVTGLLNLFKTLIFSLPALKNVAIIMALFMFIFSCFAMNTFGNVKHGELLTDDANFETFFLSFNTMWRLSSGESYNGIMHDINIKVPYCNPRQGGAVNPTEGNCGDELWAFSIMQLSFTMLNYILVNLFIAIILDNFSEQCSMSESKVTAEILEDFDDVWMEFDKKGLGKISEIRLPDMLLKIEYPLGLKNVPVEHLHGKSLRKFRNQMIQKLDIAAVNGFIERVQTKRALTAAAMDDVEWDEDAKDSVMMKRLERKVKAVDDRVTKSVSMIGGSTRRLNGKDVPYTVAHITAAKSIQSSIRGHLNRKNLEKLKEKWMIHAKLAKTLNNKNELGAPGEGLTSIEQ